MKRNINPKTLKGQDKLNRMLDLMGRMKTLNESNSYSELELIKKGPNGIVYGIIRENHDYFIKTSNKTSGKFLSEDFNYIGGLKNKSDEKYHSYSEALKHLNIKFDMLNESYGIESNTNIFETDGRTVGGGFGFGFVMEEEDEEGENKEIISDNEDEIEEQKKVLKVDAPTTEEPVEDEVSDDTELGGGIDDLDLDTDTTETDTDTEIDLGSDMGDEEGGDDTTKKIQKYTGKIGQMLRDMDEVDSDLEKYVINSIISAMHLDDMDEGDKEDIIAKLEGEEDEGGLDSEDNEDNVDLDLDTDLDLDAGEGENTGETEGMTESKVFSKKQLMESFLNRKNKTSRKRNLKENKEICEECMGAGCSVCMGEHHNMTHTNYGKFDRDEYMLDEELIGNQRKIDKNKNGRIDAEDFKMLRRGRKDRRRHIDEDEMSVLDAIETGQGYLPTGDLDRDFDGIPNRLDMDNNSDGRLDFSMGSGRYEDSDEDFIELDIDFLRNSDAPVKEPGIQKPITKPGEGDKWRTIKRPKVDPKPKAENPLMDNIDRPRPSYRRRGMFR